MTWHQTPSRKKKSVVFTDVMANTYQSQINAGFSKVCEIFKVCGIASLKYILEFHTLVCYCGDISTPWNMTLNKMNCDWLFDMSGPWLMKTAIYSRPSAISLKVWLRKTSLEEEKGQWVWQHTAGIQEFNGILIWVECDCTVKCDR